LADAYYTRAVARSFRAVDKQGEIEDYTQAIRVNPNFVDTYSREGLAHLLEDKTDLIKNLPKRFGLILKMLMPTIDEVLLT
jgi:hypothetical protein